MPASSISMPGQLALPGLGFLPVTNPALNEYNTIASDHTVPPEDPRFQQLARLVLEGDITGIPALKKAQLITSDSVAGGVNVNVRPIAAPALKKSEGLQDLRRIVATDKLRAVLTGVYINVTGKCLVATNGHALVQLPDATLTGQNRTVSLKTGEIIDERYPDYENIIPVGRPAGHLLTDLAGLRAKLYGIEKANRLISLPVIRAEIVDEENYYYFDPSLLLDVLTVMQMTGSTALRLEFWPEQNRALLLRDAGNDRKLAIVMPVMANPGGNSLTRAIALSFCTVLEFAKADGTAPKGRKDQPLKKPVSFKRGDSVRVLWTGRNELATLTYKDKNGWNYTYENGKKGTGMKPDQMELATTAAMPTLEKEPTKTADIKAKKPAKAKTPRAKKAKPADNRAEVAHFDNDLTFFRQFVALTEKPVTLVQVRNLHRKLEKAIVAKKVRKASPHAALLERVANVVASTYEKMSTAKPPILTVEKLTLPAEAVAQARALALGSKVSSAVRLLSEFINLQGEQPDAKRVAALRKSLEKEHAEHPKSDYATAVGAAAATLRDWQPGRAVGISAQQLGRLGQLSGLGCACQDHAPKPMAGTPALKHKPTAARASLGSIESLFTTIGEKDHRQAVGTLLHLPGDLGRFLGDIEDHEYALAIRGDKGAGKTRLLFQLMNLFASTGKRVGAFSLEIAKNSDVISRNTNAYIAAGNRARVQIASEAPQGLETIRQAAKAFDVVAIDSWGKIPGVAAADFDVIRKEFPNTIFLVIFQSTTAGTSRGGSSSEYDASAVCQVNLPGVAVMEKNRYATGAADELQYLVNEQRLAQPGELA